MTIKGLLDGAIKNDLIDLQALIMFLVLEKQVLKLEDDASELDLYFLEKHHKRMNAELHAYKRKMNMEPKSCAWEVHTKQGEILYVFTKDRLQARTYALTLKHEPTKVTYVPDEQLMWFNGKWLKMHEITKGLQAPELIGSYN